MWKEAEKFLLEDKYIGPLVKKWGHCTIAPKLHTDYFQGLVGDIIGQQLSGRVANVIENRLKTEITGRITPKKILDLPEIKLRNCGMAWAKVRSIKDLSIRIMNHELRIKELDTLSDEEVR